MLQERLMAMLVLLKERSPTRRDAHVRPVKLQVEALRSRLPPTSRLRGTGAMRALF